MKFADVFHTTYTHQELDVMFTFGRCVLIGQFVRSHGNYINLYAYILNTCIYSPYLTDAVVVPLDTYDIFFFFFCFSTLYTLKPGDKRFLQRSSKGFFHTQLTLKCWEGGALSTTTFTLSHPLIFSSEC